MLRKTGPDGNLHDVSCPACRCRGNFVPHGSYVRHLVVLGDEVVLIVKRVRCASCGVTHAILPEGVIPYRAFSEGFVLAVLAAWARGRSNAQVSSEFGISESTRRRILSDSRKRVCALLACNAARSAVDAAIAAAGIGRIPGLHLATFATRFAEKRRLINSQRSGPTRSGAST